MYLGGKCYTTYIMVAGHTFTVEYECGSGNDYNGRLGVRISSVFVIGIGSMLGKSIPRKPWALCYDLVIDANML